MPEASPFWQNAFVGFVILIAAWSVWCGWRAGLVREALALGGMFAGGFAGLAVGGAIGPLAGGFLPVPGVVAGGFFGLVVGIGIYVGVWFLGALLFKRTAQQRTMPLRFLYGIGGAVVGLFMGVTFVWGALLFVRGLGGFYQGRFEAPAMASGRPHPNAAEAALVKLKRSIEAGPTGRQLVAVDVVPAEYYRILDKLGLVAARPEALRRLLEYPQILELVNAPAMIAITSDPAANDAAEARDVGALMKNSTVLAAARDPDLIAKIQKIDLERALDFALATPDANAKPSARDPHQP